MVGGVQCIAQEHDDGVPACSLPSEIPGPLPPRVMKITVNVEAYFHSRKHAFLQQSEVFAPAAECAELSRRCNTPGTTFHLDIQPWSPRTAKTQCSTLYTCAGTMLDTNCCQICTLALSSHVQRQNPSRTDPALYTANTWLLQLHT